MNNRDFKTISLAAIFAILSVTVVVAGCTTQQGPTATPTAAPPANKTVTDLAGRTVVVPYSVQKVVVVGAVPPMNSFILAMGEGDTIINGLPTFARTPMYRFQWVFAPHLATGPDLGSSPGVENILALNPDVVFAGGGLSQDSAEAIANSGVPVIYLTTDSNISIIKATMNILGQVYDDPARAQEYSDYYNATVAKVSSRIASVPESDRPKVVYWLPSYSMRVGGGSGWIEAAGGVDVAGDSGITGMSTVSAEQMLKWDPDVIIVQDATADIAYINNNKTVYGSLSAVKDGKVYPTPIGACWWYRSPENVLMVEWTASKLYPDKFPESEVIGDMKAFYKEFYGYNLTDQDAYDMLGGMVNSTAAP